MRPRSGTERRRRRSRPSCSASPKARRPLPPAYVRALYAKSRFRRCERQTYMRIAPKEMHRGVMKSDEQVLIPRLGPEQGDPGPRRGGDVGTLMVKARLPRNRIDRERDPVPDAATLDQGHAGL